MSRQIPELILFIGSGVRNDRTNCSLTARRQSSQLPTNREIRIGPIRAEVSGPDAAFEVDPQLRIQAGDLIYSQANGARDVDARPFGDRGGNSRAAVAVESAAQLPFDCFYLVFQLYRALLVAVFF